MKSLDQRRLINQLAHEADTLKEAVPLSECHQGFNFCIVQTLSMKRSYIRSLQLLRIDDSNLIAVIVTDSGVIKNHRIKVNNVPSNEESH